MKNYSKIAFVFSGVILLSVLTFFFLNAYNKSYIDNISDYVASITKTSSGLPVRLTIPSINVDAPIIQVGLLPDGSVDAPKGPYEVAWFNLGPRPGEKGSSVIVGHYGKWQTGANSVFDNLYKLSKGDKISVKNDKGVITNFIVRESRTYNPGDSVPDIFNKKDGTYLNLITCSGIWIPGEETYDKRLVIFADIENLQ